jgi:aminoglycoside phosphotransferase (APT) family kinase protein
MGRTAGVAPRPHARALLADDARQVARWLRAHQQPVAGSVRIRRIGIGQSNITSVVADAVGRQWVLREPPPGSHRGSAHDVAREAGIIAALAASPIPVPTVIGVGERRCGSSFFVMERVPGAPLENEADAAALSAAQRYRLGVEVITTLARLHRLALSAAGLASHSTPYLQRQIRRISDAWLGMGSDSDHDSAWRAVQARLLERAPDKVPAPVIMHGDFRLSNLLVADGEITAVLDWELCTAGDPLADLAWLLDDWRAPEDPAISMPSPTRAGGFPTREELVDIYTAESGVPVDHLDYYRGFSQWRAASLLQGVMTRRLTGAMGSHGAIDLHQLDVSIATLLSSAASHLRGA